MKKNLSILLITIFFSANCQDLYFPSKGNWEVKLPSEFNYNSKKIQKAIDFVIENQNNGDKDLRVEILKGFSTEPYHSIKGPTSFMAEANKTPFCPSARLLAAIARCTITWFVDQ